MISLRKTLYIFAFLGLLFGLMSPESLFAQHPYRVKTIVIDAGHGAHDGGTKGSRIQEKDLTLQIALKLGKALQQDMKDVNIIYTRTTDVFIDLYKRIGLANEKKADLFISIHANSMPHIRKRVVSGYRKNKAGKRVPIYKTSSVPNQTTRGTETFVSGFHRLGEQDVAVRENASMLLEDNYEENYQGFDPNDPESYIIFSLMKDQFREQSIKLATFIENEYKKSGRLSRGVKEQGLAVLAAAGMPAVLTEIGFISNPQEEQHLLSDKGQTEVVQNLLTAIKNFKNQVEN